MNPERISNIKKGISRLEWITGAAVIASAACMATGWPFFHFITYAGKKKGKSGGTDPNRRKWFQLKHTEINHPRHEFPEAYEASKEWCRQQQMQDVYIRSFDGKKLHASYFPADKTERIVLLSHGYRGTRFGSVSGVAKTLHEQHSSLLFIDQRCCGESGGKYITFGAREQMDVRGWLEWIRKRNVAHLPIYLYGQSMGATTVLLAAGHRLPEEVHGIIADCGFHSMPQQLRDIASGWFHLPRIQLLLFNTDLFCRLFGKFKMRDTNTTGALRRNRRPVLFFHGKADTYVWPENTVKNYQICRAPKELVLIPKARHLCCFYAAPELYRQKLTEFFQRYDQPGQDAF